MSRVLGAALRGVDGVAVEVEVRISSQLPRTEIVGLPEAAVRESAARVRAAIASTGQRYPDRRVTVNLAPAGLRKSGAGLDLPIAIGVLAAAGAVEGEALRDLALVGELALDGRLRPVRGALALCLAARAAGCRRAIVPVDNGPEAGLAPGLTVHTGASLADVLNHLNDVEALPVVEAPQTLPDPPPGPDLADVRGQATAVRALVIAAAGGHGLLLRGAPGSGKTMLARRLAGILPPLAFDEALEVTRIRSAAGQSSESEPVALRRPFRAPHHSASTAGMLGGGNPPRPGEVSLAHRGVLFLDELPEFDRRTLESLRQVLEDRRVVVARARTSCEFPADFQFIAAANPCPCGWLGSGRRDCRCDDGTVARYSARMSGPLLDRIDMHVAVRPVAWRDLDGPAGAPQSADIRARVAGARGLQRERCAPFGGNTNADLPDAAIDDLVGASPDARDLLGRAVERRGLSARAARRLLKVARTIADLGGEERVGPAAMAEAIGYRGDDDPPADA